MDSEDSQEKIDEFSISQRISGLETKFVFIQHQLSSIMKHLHAIPCKCSKCSKTNEVKEAEKKQPTPSEMLSQLFPAASPQQLKALLELSKSLKSSEKPPKTQEEPVKLGQYNQNSTSSGGGKIVSERLSEPVRKPRKAPFGLPASQFYQRKDSTPLTPLTPSMPTLTPMSANTSNASPGPSSSDGGDDHLEMPIEVASAIGKSLISGSAPTTPGTNLFSQSMVDMLKLQNAAHSTGSPGFLRGRGRGRPKLIGDELDADLVDYMVSLKNSDPHGGHFTASQALHMARQYILERAPGLLEEHGGHVKLKLTWAMKLVSRIGERQKEIEYGLPAGTLSNMGRNLTNLQPGGNFMADVMAQNIFSQQMMMMNQQLKTDTKETNEENLNGTKKILKVETPAGASTIPELVNIKELNLPFLNNLLAELHENNSSATAIDGELVTMTAPLFAASNA